MVVVATKFNVKHQGKDIHHPPSINDLLVTFLGRPFALPFPWASQLRELVGVPGCAMLTSLNVTRLITRNVKQVRTSTTDISLVSNIVSFGNSTQLLLQTTAAAPLLTQCPSLAKVRNLYSNILLILQIHPYYFLNKVWNDIVSILHFISVNCWSVTSSVRSVVVGA